MIPDYMDIDSPEFKQLLAQHIGNAIPTDEWNSLLDELKEQLWQEADTVWYESFDNPDEI